MATTVVAEKETMAGDKGRSGDDEIEREEAGGRGDGEGERRVKARVGGGGGGGLYDARGSGEKLGHMAWSSRG